jgi:hypothetical protein
MSDFAVQLRSFGDKAIENSETVVRKTALDILRRVVRRTPVGNPSLWQNPSSAPPGYTGGRARANWQATIGTPAQGTIESTDQGRAMRNAPTVLRRIRGDVSVYLTNNLPYITELETGHSQQAPRGMVRVTLREFNGIVERNTRGMA